MLKARAYTHILTHIDIRTLACTVLLVYVQGYRLEVLYTHIITHVERINAMELRTICLWLNGCIVRH